MAKESKTGTPPERFFAALATFAERLTGKFSATGPGDPEDQLKGPVDHLFAAFSEITSSSIVLKGETRLGDRLGRPDFAAHRGQLPIGFIELKAPGKGANPDTFKGHDRDQWKRFQSVPNILYTDGNEWALFHGGELAPKRIRLVGDIRSDGKAAVSAENGRDLFNLFADFLGWTPIVPAKPKELAAFLAPFCRLIREEVLDALGTSASPLHALKGEIKALLFPDADDRQFADAYAQTVVFALLLCRMEGADVLDLRRAYDALEHRHALLSRSLEFLTDKEARAEISASLGLAQRVIHEIPPDILKATAGKQDPWLFFYEDFLATYDSELRKKSGVYFTPIEVVRCQVRLVDEILRAELGRPMGFVEAGVATLDPALGTGTYLLGIVDHALARVAKEEGPGAVKGGARALVHNLHGFEWMVGPYSVAQLRFSQALSRQGITLPESGPGIYLTNTLESPHTHPPAPPLFHRPIAREHERALKIKDSERILVCLGNPPYGRHEAAGHDNQALTGGWVRYGDQKHDPDQRPVLEDFLEPARRAGHGVHLKNLYNLYVYFIRWSLWKVFEHKLATGPGILSFITASSYLEGDAFVGLREHMRRVCERIDIIDLGGEGRGTRKEENVFAIQTPVAIFVAWRKGTPDAETPAVVRYARIEGTREEKLEALDAVHSSGDLRWQDVPSGWQDPFVPSHEEEFFEWPVLTDLLPWQQSGPQVKRLWPIAPAPGVLVERWRSLSGSEDKATLFKETRDRVVGKGYPDLQDAGVSLPAIADAAPHPIPPVRYAYRSFDRQWLIPDNRVGDYLRPVLWKIFGSRQLFFVGLFSIPVGPGPALVANAFVPDMDCFRGSFGAKAVMPLFRDGEGSRANLAPGLQGVLESAFKRKLSSEDIAGYLYSVLAQPEYTRRFADQLIRKEVRVPLTKDGKLFVKVAAFGRELIWLHTYGERFYDAEHAKGAVPQGAARCAKAVSGEEERYPNECHYTEATKTVHVGDGTFAPVSPEVWGFEVSGLKVVQSWLGYRMKDRSGKKSSPLDDIRPKVWTREFTREFLELLWVLERTVAGYPKQKQLLEAVLASDLFRADELPPVPESAREAPKAPKSSPGQGRLDL